MCELNAVVRKQQNVKAAITLSVKAKIVFNLERNVFIFEERLKAEVLVSKSKLKIRPLNMINSGYVWVFKYFQFENVIFFFLITIKGNHGKKIPDVNK